jgi:hypothetical protein
MQKYATLLALLLMYITDRILSDSYSVQIHT